MPGPVEKIASRLLYTVRFAVSLVLRLRPQCASHSRDVCKHAVQARATRAMS